MTDETPCPFAKVEIAYCIEVRKNVTHKRMTVKGTALTKTMLRLEEKGAWDICFRNADA